MPSEKNINFLTLVLSNIFLLDIKILRLWILQQNNNIKSVIFQLEIYCYFCQASESMDFEIVGEITDAETFAIGLGVRDRKRLWKLYGKGRWRKRKGVAKVRLPSGRIRLAELHWYEAHGIGKREFKLKLPFLD